MYIWQWINVFKVILEERDEIGESTYEPESFNWIVADLENGEISALSSKHSYDPQQENNNTLYDNCMAFENLINKKNSRTGSYNEGVVQRRKIISVGHIKSEIGNKDH